ncbi:unnamed protein product [Phytomonas sp. EM1]|nr:unnamed protein product [Phytomonas sp. EM1]|eukprot:CCW61401.1 unnamed protein product [Phytomonas sp. isolate EM1]
MPLMSAFLTLFTWIMVIIVLVSFLLWTIGMYFRKKQGSFLYFPSEPPNSRNMCASPADAGILNFECVSISTLDGQVLKGYLMWPYPPSSAFSTGNGKVSDALSTKTFECGATPPLAHDSSNSPNEMPPFVLLFFHGNSGNVGHRLAAAKLFLATLKCAVLMVDYRGYGLSSSAAVTQEGLEIDAQACLDFIKHDERLPQESVYVMGTSLGAAVALHLAAKPRNARSISGVIVENTFTSISDMVVILANSVIHLLRVPCPRFALLCFSYYVLPLTLHLKWENIGILHKISAPMLFLSGLKDELVPPEQMRLLYQAACAKNHKGNPLRRLVTFREGSHNDMLLCDGYFQAISDFVNDVEKSKISDFI